jgi:hypothetical protein
VAGYDKNSVLAAVEGEMARIDRAYVTIGLALLVLAMLLGFYMGAAADNKYLNVHVALALGGFVVLTIYGVLYRLWPSLKDAVLAKAQFWSAVIGALLLPVAAAMIANQMGIAVAVVGSVLAIVGAILMLWIFWSRPA